MIFIHFTSTEVDDTDMPRIKIDPTLWDPTQHLQPTLTAAISILGQLLDRELEAERGKTLHVAKKKLILPGEE